MTREAQEQFLAAIKSGTLKDAVALVKRTLATDDVRLVRGLLLVYGNQTADEQASETTKHENGRGFNGADAEFLTQMAKQAKRWIDNPASRRFDSPLSPKQTACVRRGMGKYAKQIVLTIRGEL